MKKLLIATATFNEEDSILELLEQILKFAPEADVLVVDDSSTDKTVELIKSFTLTLDKIKIIVRPAKLGVGSAHLFAMLYSINNSYDYLITLDADLSHHPQYLSELKNALSSNDFVAGSRYVHGGKCNYTFPRVALSWTANFLVRSLLKLPIRETTTSYRGFSVPFLKKVVVGKRLPEGYAFFFDIAHRACKLTDRIIEIPIEFNDRRFGSTKISKIEIVRALVHLLNLLIFNKKIEQSDFVNSLPFNRIENPCPCCHSTETSLRYPPTKDLTKYQKQISDDYACNTLSHKTRGGIADCFYCGNSFLFPQPNKDELIKNYSNVVDPTYAENFDARLKTFSYNWDRVKRLAPRTGELLDIGCYCGAFLQIALQDGYSVEGLEPSRWAANYCRGKLAVKVHCEAFDFLSSNDKRYDIITAWDVLEHVTEPVDFLKKVNGSLNPGGIFFFSTLNIDNWFPKILGKNWPWFIDMHLTYFKEKTLIPMLEQNGFKILEVRSYCHIITARYFFRKLAALKIPGIKITSSFLARVFPKIFIPFKFGDIVLVTCCKDS